MRPDDGTKKYSEKMYEVVRSVTEGREASYASPEDIARHMVRLIQFTVDQRDCRAVDSHEIQAARLIAGALKELGYRVDVNVSRDLWELISSDSQAQWLYPPTSHASFYVNLVNTANNMAKGECYINFG
jgi:hypothetical protein